MTTAREKHHEPPAVTGALVRELEQDLFRYARRRVKDDDVARELVQETWVAALEGMSRFAGRASLKTWLTAILRRKIADLYRYRKPTVSFEETQHEESSGGEAVVRQLDARRRAERVEEALAQLTPRERMAVELCGVEEMDRAEAAEKMGVSRPCLRVTLCRGRRPLREVLEAA